VGCVACNTIWKGNKSPLIFDDTTIVIFLLLSIPRILTCFLPLISQVVSPTVGTRWTLVLSLLLLMERECCKLHWVWNLMTHVTFLFTPICWNFSCYICSFRKQPIHVMFNKLTSPFPYNQKVTKMLVKNFKVIPLTILQKIGWTLLVERGWHASRIFWSLATITSLYSRIFFLGQANCACAWWANCATIVP
jgi:hypothetical protein